MNIQLTDEQRDQVAALYETQVGKLAAYEKLIMPIKRIACAMAVGTVLHLTVDLFEDALEDEEFQTFVDSIIEAFEVLHPDKVNPAEQVAKAMTELAKGLNWEGMRPPDAVVFSVAPDGETESIKHDPKLHAEFESIISHMDEDSTD